MLKHQILDERISQKNALPAEIEAGLLALFNVRDMATLEQEDLDKIATLLNECLTKSKSEEGYSKTAKAYALYYLPVNFYKIWRPLYDLLIWDQIPTSAKLLELGAGPGTSTLGLIYFYIALAQENTEKEFNIHIHIVEQHEEFSTIFHRLYNYIKDSIPGNLNISFSTINALVINELRKNTEQYDIIFESNMFNHNEHINRDDIPEYAELLKNHLSKHGSLVLIEPAERTLTQYLYFLKTALLNLHMTCFSPCSCNNLNCCQFSSARVDISLINLYARLVETGLVQYSKSYHSFEYAIFRSDGLTKHTVNNTGVRLIDISNHIGERIRTSGFVLTCLDKSDELSIKICDGSLQSGRQIWANIPKSIMSTNDVHCLVQGRGSYVKIRNAKVLSGRELGIDFSTIIEISR